jgi:hypothetical protein
MITCFSEWKDLQNTIFSSCFGSSM